MTPSVTRAGTACDEDDDHNAEGDHHIVMRGRHGIHLRLDPERYPGHHDNQTSGDVRVEHEIS